jgi:hypothetical protein
MNKGALHEYPNRVVEVLISVNDSVYEGKNIRLLCSQTQRSQSHWPEGVAKRALIEI